MEPSTTDSGSNSTKQTTTDEFVTPESVTDPLTIGGVEVLDVTVHLNLGYGNSAELKIYTDSDIPKSAAFPIDADEPVDGTIIGETDEGMLFGWQNEPVQPPADTSPRTTTETIVHEEAGEIERVPKYDHGVKSVQNKREPQSALSVKVDADYTHGRTITVELAQTLIDHYVNGPLGSDVVPDRMKQYNEGGARKRKHINPDKYDDYLNCDIVLCEERICTWEPVPTFEADDRTTYQ